MPGPAARLTDTCAHGGLIVGPGVPTVLIGGMPASVLGDMHVCPMVTPGVPPIPHVGGPISMPGAPTVLIGGRPATTMGCICVCVGPPDSVVMGAPTVILGAGGAGSASSGGGGGGGGAAAAQASAAAAAFNNLESVTKEAHWVEFKFVDKAGLPVSGVAYRFTDPDKKATEGVLRLDGRVRRDALPKEGACEVVLMSVTDAKWSKTAEKVGESVDLEATVDGFEDGTEAVIQVFRRDVRGPDVLVDEWTETVQGGKVSGTWTPEPPEAEDGVLVPPEGTMSSPDEPTAYASPDFYFEVIVGACKARSGLLHCEDYIEVEVVDEDGNALAGEDYILYLSNGEIRKGTLDGSGKLREEGIPPGFHKLRLPNLPDYEADV